MSWHQTPAAVSIIARCHAHDFTLKTVACATHDELEYFGRNEKACALLRRLEDIRRQAVDRAVGYRFVDLGVTEPWDQDKADAYMAVESATDGVHVVLRDTFRARQAERAAA